MSADNFELRSVMSQIDGQSGVLYDRFNALFNAWEAAPRDQSTVAVQEGLHLLAAAEQLDDYLATYVDGTRQRTIALSRYYVVIPAVLAPIAVLAMVLAIWLGRRLQLFAHVADAKRAEVVQAAEARAALLRGVTHDVKNPLAAAAGYASLLEEGIVGPVTPEQREMIGRIHHLVGVSVQTVTDLLDLARADANLHVDYVATDLGALVTEVVDDHRGLAIEHNLRLEVDAPRSPVVTDPKRVRRIVTNILSNAIKYTPSGGEVHASITADPRAQRLGVVVRDNGPGIPPDLQSKVFEEFFRVRGASNGSSGNGLGLAISRRIARLLGGDVSYAPAKGGGSVFTVWLPAADGSKH
jgi:signal transduction histidine kinase